MEDRMRAGLAFVYTTRSGRRWYIDAALNLPCRQCDFAEAMYDAFSLDGLGLFVSYPSLSICQLALEEECPDWRGEGWYVLGPETEPETHEWIGSLEELKERVSVLEKQFKETGIGFFAEYAGSGSEPYII